MDSPAASTGPASSGAANLRRASALRPELLIGGILIVLAALVMGWFIWQQAQEKPVTIGEILGDLRKYDGISVTVKGTAEAPTNLFGVMKFYDLRDSSGTIKVVTERGLPAEGSEITVTGVVKQAMQVAGMELTVLYEPATGEEGE